MSEAKKDAEEKGVDLRKEMVENLHNLLVSVENGEVLGIAMVVLTEENSAKTLLLGRCVRLDMLGAVTLLRKHMDMAFEVVTVKKSKEDECSE